MWPLESRRATRGFPARSARCGPPFSASVPVPGPAACLSARPSAGSWACPCACEFARCPPSARSRCPPRCGCGSARASAGWWPGGMAARVRGSVSCRRPLRAAVGFGRGPGPRREVGAVRDPWARHPVGARSLAHDASPVRSPGRCFARASPAATCGLPRPVPAPVRVAAPAARPVCPPGWCRTGGSSRRGWLGRGRVHRGVHPRCICTGQPVDAAAFRPRFSPPSVRGHRVPAASSRCRRGCSRGLGAVLPSRGRRRRRRPVPSAASGPGGGPGRRRPGGSAWPARPCPWCRWWWWAMSRPRPGASCGRPSPPRPPTCRSGAQIPDGRSPSRGQVGAKSTPGSPGQRRVLAWCPRHVAVACPPARVLPPPRGMPRAARQYDASTSEILSGESSHRRKARSTSRDVAPWSRCIGVPPASAAGRDRMQAASGAAGVSAWCA